MSEIRQYKILVREGETEGKPYPLAARCAAVVKELRKLQVDTTFYTVQERYVMVKEMLWEREWITTEETEKDGDGKETGQTTYELKAPSLNKDEFLIEAAMVLFPDAPVSENPDYVDFEVAIQALEDFTTRTDRKTQKLNALFS